MIFLQTKENTFVHNTAILFFGRVCTKLIQFFLLPLYTSMLSTSEYGTIDLISTYVTILVVFVNLQVEQAIFRYLTENRENEQLTRNIITNVIAISFLQILIFSIIYFFIQSYIQLEGKLFLLLNVIASIFMLTMLNITRGLGDYKSYAKASFFAAISVIVLNILFLVILKQSVNGLLLSTCISYTLSGLYLFQKKKIHIYIRKDNLNKKRRKEILHYSIPLIPNELSWQMIKSSDKIIVSAIMGNSWNGILSIATKFSSVFTEIYNVFNTSLLDTMILNLKTVEGQKYINQLINHIYRLFLSLAFMIVAGMPFLFGIFIHDSYIEAYNYIPLYMIASILNVMIGITSGVFLAEKNTKLIAETSFIAGIINIFIDLLLMRTIGLYAATFSTILGFFIMFLLRYRIIRKNYLIQISSQNIQITIIGFSLLLMVYYMGTWILQIVTLLLVIMISIYLNKEMIKRGYEIILSNKKWMTKSRNFWINPVQRKKLTNKNFTILSNNCIGGFLYQDFELPYLSPTVNLYISPKDFVKFCKDIKKYVNLEMKEGTDETVNCPIGVIEDIKIYFVHYKTFKEGKEKWDNRKKRINYQNIYCMMTDRNTVYCNPEVCEEEVIYEFDSLPIKNKVVFTSKKFDLNSVHYLPKYKNKVVEVATDYINLFGKYVIESNGFDCADFLNKR